MSQKSKADKTDNYFIRTVVYKLYLSKKDKERFNEYCAYRRYVWNKYKDVNDQEYQAYCYEKLYYDKTGFRVKSSQYCSKYPSFTRIDKLMNQEKQSWEYQYPSKIALLAKHDYDHALSNFKDKTQPDWGKPKFKSKKAPKQGFKLVNESARLSGRTALIAKGRQDKKHGNLRLKARRSFLDYSYGNLSFYTEKGKYYLAVPYYVPKALLKQNNHPALRVGIDLNVGHYNLYDGKKAQEIKLNLPRLEFHYQRIKHYQRLLASKRVTDKENINSHNYAQTTAKLEREYERVDHLQNDFLQKLTTILCRKYHTIVIEDLDVKHMKMGIASKGLHRAMFGKFRQILTYKTEQYGNKLIIADRLYPSTQICSNCGFRKTGDEKITLWGNLKHHTKHNEYICYNCGAKLDRDDNAAINLYQYPNTQWYQDNILSKEKASA